MTYHVYLLVTLWLEYEADARFRASTRQRLRLYASVLLVLPATSALFVSMSAWLMGSVLVGTSLATLIGCFAEREPGPDLAKRARGRVGTMQQRLRRLGGLLLFASDVAVALSHVAGWPEALHWVIPLWQGGMLSFVLADLDWVDSPLP